MNLRDPKYDEKKANFEDRYKRPYLQFRAILEGNGNIYVEDDNFHHDVRMTIDGDFESLEERLEYAVEVARILNEAMK